MGGGGAHHSERARRRRAAIGLEPQRKALEVGLGEEVDGPSRNQRLLDGEQGLQAEDRVHHEALLEHDLRTGATVFIVLELQQVLGRDVVHQHQVVAALELVLEAPAARVPEILAEHVVECDERAAALVVEHAVCDHRKRREDEQERDRDPDQRL